MVHHFISSLFCKMEYYNVVSNLSFMFHIDTLKYANILIKKIPVTSNFKTETLSDILTRKSMGNNDLESNQTISDVKYIDSVLRCDPLQSKRHHKINLIDSISMIFYFSSKQNSLDEEFVEKED